MFKSAYEICFFMLFCLFEGQAVTLMIENVGLLDFYEKDVAMVFFVQVRTQEPESSSYYAQIESIQCCEIITKEEKDCESMKLMGGYLKINPYGESTNLTMYYPTLYGYNRQGTCLIQISYGGAYHHQLTQEIVFNTIIKLNDIPKGLGHFYDPTKIAPCKSLDEDPFKFCAPVNCMAKYSGMRNIFNLTTARCEKAATCSGEKVYDPVNNKCRKLSQITQQDRHEFDNLSTMRQKVNLFQGICHKGKVEMGACICDAGWKTIRHEDSTVESLHFCNIPYSENIFTTQSLKTLNMNEMICSIIIAALILIIIILVDRKYENKSRNTLTPTQYPNISYYRVIHSENH